MIQGFAGGTARGDVIEGALFPETDAEAPQIAPSWTTFSVLGPIREAEALSALLGSDATIGIDQAPLTDRIAEVAVLKLGLGADIARPAPLYVRPADAAPSSDPPPVILP